MIMFVQNSLCIGILNKKCMENTKEAYFRKYDSRSACIAKIYPASGIEEPPKKNRNCDCSNRPKFSGNRRG